MDVGKKRERDLGRIPKKKMVVCASFIGMCIKALLLGTKERASLSHYKCCETLLY